MFFISLRRILSLLGIACGLCMSLSAAVITIPPQYADTLRPTQYATSVSALRIAHTHQLNTYLSSLPYVGTLYSYWQSNAHPTGLWQGRIVTQRQWQLDFSPLHTDIPQGQGKAWYFNTGYTVQWYYTMPQLGTLRWYAGVGLMGRLGATYDVQNGNNPVQAHVTLAVPASLQLVQPFRLWHQHMTVRYQLDFPLVGLAFSPVYNQSYYELFLLQQQGSNVRFTYPGNAPTFVQQFSFDWHLHRTLTLRIGLWSEVYQQRLNGIRSHSWTHGVGLGIVRHLLRISPTSKASHHFVY